MEQTGLIDFSDLETKNQLDLYIQKKVKEDGSNPIRGISFLASENPITIFTEHDLNGYSVDIQNKEEFIRLDISRRIDHSKYDDDFKIFEATVYVISHVQEEVYTAFSICEGDVYEKCVRSYISKIPRASLSYLTTNELQGVFDVFDDQISGDIIVEEAVIKSPSSKTDILYLKEPYYNLFNTKKVGEGDYYVDKVNFSVVGRSSFSGFLSRRGDTRYSKGSSGVYFDYLLDIAGEALIEKGTIFENKSREYGSREANRLEINYEPGTIQGKEANYDLIDALRNMGSASLTVYHKNPYFHGSVLDFNDGSSADVFITSDQTISIIPGFEASQGSLSRICERITSHFQEGSVSEADSEDPEVDDFFTG